MRFEVLGPVRVVREGKDPGPISDLRRRLLAMLLARANRTVSTDLLGDALWTDKPPDRPDKSLQIHIHRLRQVLDDPGRLAGTPGGYRFEVGPGELDADVFAGLQVEARRTGAAGDLDAAADRLREALALWRGTPYADVDESLVVAPEARRLAEGRMLALEELYDTELARGHGREIVPELSELVSEYPLRERFTAQLMHALYRAGRRARALTTFRNARTRLADQLGTEPGRELRTLEAAIRAEDPGLLPEATAPGDASSPSGPVAEAPVVAPAHLPPAPRVFVGRETELAEMEEAAKTVDGAGPILLTGMAGVGKTGLAVRFAHSVADRFPDGQLYIDLRGHAPEPALEPLNVLGHLLRALGMDQARSASVLEAGGLDAATAEFRSLVANQRVLLLLDNAASTEQVRPLLPATRTCLTLVTSRNRLSGLVAHDSAHRIALRVLPGDEAQTLLSELAGRKQLGHHGGELADACAGLPLALRIAGARLADEPHLSVDEYLVDLRTGGPTELALEDDERSAVAPAFDLSYRGLDPAARRLFRLLGLVPGLDVTVPAAAALCRTTEADARRLIRRLTGAHLLEEYAAGRFRFHDLLRAYARHRAEDEDDVAARNDAVERLLAWYYQGKSVAVLRRSARRREPTPPEVPGDLPEVDFPDGRAATAWLGAEFDNLAAAVRFAAQTGRFHWCWHLALGAGLAGLDDGRVGEVLPMLRTAVAAARDADDHAALAHTMIELSAALHLAGLVVPDELLTEALGHAETSGEHGAWGYGLTVAGAVRSRQQRFRDAEAYVLRALEVHRARGDGSSQGMALNSLASITYGLGDLHHAERYSEQVLELDAPKNTSTAFALVNLIAIRILLGKLDGCEELFARAQATVSTVGDEVAAFRLRRKRVDLLCVRGRYDEALRLAGEGAEHAEDLKQPQYLCEADVDLGRSRLGLGNLDTAVTALERANRLAAEHNFSEVRARALRNLAEAHLAKGDLHAAFRYGEDAIEAAQRSNPLLQNEALVTAARIELALGRSTESIDHGETALTIAEETGHVLGQAHAHRVLGEAHTAAGRTAERDEHLREALRRYEIFGTPEAREARNSPAT